MVDGDDRGRNIDVDGAGGRHRDERGVADRGPLARRRVTLDVLLNQPAQVRAYAQHFGLGPLLGLFKQGAGNSEPEGPLFNGLHLETPVCRVS